MIVMRTNFFLRLFLVFNFIIGVSLAGCNVENNEKKQWNGEKCLFRESPDTSGLPLSELFYSEFVLAAGNISF